MNGLLLRGVFDSPTSLPGTPAVAPGEQFLVGRTQPLAHLDDEFGLLDYPQIGLERKQQLAIAGRNPSSLIHLSQTRDLTTRTALTNTSDDIVGRTTALDRFRDP